MTQVELARCLKKPQSYLSKVEILERRVKEIRNIILYKVSLYGTVERV